MDKPRKRFEPRKRTALDGQKWWCVWDNKKNEWSTLIWFGRYRSRSGCLYGISRVRQEIWNEKEGKWTKSEN